jgi:ATP-dependent DNA helicase DinG
LDAIHAAFDLLDLHFQVTPYTSKWRVVPHDFQSSRWKNEMVPAFEKLADELKRFQTSLAAIEKEIDEETKPKVEGDLVAIGQVIDRIQETLEGIASFFSAEELVRWAEKTHEGTHLAATRLDVAPFLEERLFDAVDSVVLCSATLTVKNVFDHVRENIGLTRESIEGVFPSPFDYKQRVRLLGIRDLPSPTEQSYNRACADAIRDAIEQSGGGAFVLFTSYDMLTKVSGFLSDLPHLKQGEGPRHALLETFKEQKNGVLLGTDSFWEGVDVAGEALRLVILVKLPFPVPSEPLAQARSEALKKMGRDPFMEDSVPQAVVKFKQGFGRLMRRKGDWGAVLCLDRRLFERPYGKTFFESLPECITTFSSKAAVMKELKDFYRNGA